MKYNLYYHDDFDGTASGAIFFDFLKSRGYELGELHPVQYTPALKSAWPDYDFKHPFILVDFMYHPSAEWWLDHHETAFIKKEWQDNFKNTDKHVFDKTAPSAAGLILRHLEQTHDYQPSQLIRDLLPWLDIIDGAKYKSVEQFLEMRESAIQIARLISYLHDDARLGIQKYLIENLAMQSLEDILVLPMFAEPLAHMKSEQSESLKHLDSCLVIHDKVAVIDSTISKTYIQRFSEYYVHPELSYSVTLKEHSGEYHISVGRNPWLADSPKVNIGEFLAHYGGGGHQNVGGVETKTRTEMDTIINDVVQYLNQNG